MATKAVAHNRDLTPHPRFNPHAFGGNAQTSKTPHKQAAPPATQKPQKSAAPPGNQKPCIGYSAKSDFAHPHPNATGLSPRPFGERGPLGTTGQPGPFMRNPMRHP
jgi:hypothetical protein